MEVQAVCHVHSSWSYDGSWSIDKLARTFAKRGCRVLLMSDHDRGFTDSRFAEFREACAKASTDQIHVVPGIEYSDAPNRIHVLVWGVPCFLGENLETTALLGLVEARDGVAVLAHPDRRDAWLAFEPAWTDRLLGIEAWNRKYDGWAPGLSAPALLAASSCVPFVGLDFHTSRQMFPLTMTLDIDGPIDEASVVDALRRRRCSARAFGTAFSSSLSSSGLPLLRAAEGARRRAALVVRRVRARRSGHGPRLT